MKSSYTVLMSAVRLSVMVVIRNVVNHVAGEVFIHSATVHCASVSNGCNA